MTLLVLFSFLLLKQSLERQKTKSNPILMHWPQAYDLIEQ